MHKDCKAEVNGECLHIGQRHGPNCPGLDHCPLYAFFSRDTRKKEKNRLRVMTYERN